MVFNVPTILQARLYGCSIPEKTLIFDTICDLLSVFDNNTTVKFDFWMNYCSLRHNSPSESHFFSLLSFDLPYYFSLDSQSILTPLFNLDEYSTDGTHFSYDIFRSSILLDQSTCEGALVNQPTSLLELINDSFTLSTVNHFIPTISTPKGLNSIFGLVFLEELENLINKSTNIDFDLKFIYNVFNMNEDESSNKFDGYTYSKVLNLIVNRASFLLGMELADTFLKLPCNAFQFIHTSLFSNQNLITDQKMFIKHIKTFFSYFLQENTSIWANFFVFTSEAQQVISNIIHQLEKEEIPLDLDEKLSQLTSICSEAALSLRKTAFKNDYYSELKILDRQESFFWELLMFEGKGKVKILNEVGKMVTEMEHKWKNEGKSIIQTFDMLETVLNSSEVCQRYEGYNLLRDYWVDLKVCTTKLFTFFLSLKDWYSPNEKNKIVDVAFAKKLISLKYNQIVNSSFCQTHFNVRTNFISIYKSLAQACYLYFSNYINEGFQMVLSLFDSLQTNYNTFTDDINQTLKRISSSYFGSEVLNFSVHYSASLRISKVFIRSLQDSAERLKEIKNKIDRTEKTSKDSIFFCINPSNFPAPDYIFPSKMNALVMACWNDAKQKIDTYLNEGFETHLNQSNRQNLLFKVSQGFDKNYKILQLLHNNKIIQSSTVPYQKEPLDNNAAIAYLNTTTSDSADCSGKYQNIEANLNPSFSFSIHNNAAPRTAADDTALSSMVDKKGSDGHWFLDCALKVCFGGSLSDSFFKLITEVSSFPNFYRTFGVSFPMDLEHYGNPGTWLGTFEDKLKESLIAKSERVCMLKFKLRKILHVKEKTYQPNNDKTKYVIERSVADLYNWDNIVDAERGLKLYLFQQTMTKTVNTELMEWVTEFGILKSKLNALYGLLLPILKTSYVFVLDQVQFMSSSIVTITNEWKSCSDFIRVLPDLKSYINDAFAATDVALKMNTEGTNLFYSRSINSLTTLLSSISHLRDALDFVSSDPKNPNQRDDDKKIDKITYVRRLSKFRSSGYQLLQIAIETDVFFKSEFEYYSQINNNCDETTTHFGLDSDNNLIENPSQFVENAQILIQNNIISHSTSVWDIVISGIHSWLSKSACLNGPIDTARILLIKSLVNLILRLKDDIEGLIDRISPYSFGRYSVILSQLSSMASPLIKDASRINEEKDNAMEIYLDDTIFFPNLFEVVQHSTGIFFSILSDLLEPDKSWAFQSSKIIIKPVKIPKIEITNHNTFSNREKATQNDKYFFQKGISLQTLIDFFNFLPPLQQSSLIFLITSMAALASMALIYMKGGLKKNKKVNLDVSNSVENNSSTTKLSDNDT